MNALSNDTFHRGLFVEAESKFAARLPQPARIAAIAGVLVATMVCVMSVVSSNATQRETGLTAATAAVFDNQFDPLELDMSAKPRNRVVALADIAFNPLLP